MHIQNFLANYACGVSDTMNLIFENLEFDPTPVIQNQKREYVPAQIKKLFAKVVACV
jgi:hypothetical protein